MDYRCPNCKVDESTAGVKLVFSICGHHICDVCLKTLFRIEILIQCPTCQRQLKRSDYSNKYIEDQEIEKDREVRKKVLEIYGKLEEDFISKSEYYDYLETIENIIEDILSQRNLENIKQKMDIEKENNKQSLMNFEIRKNAVLEKLYSKAIIEDSIYDENLRDRAKKLLEEKEDESMVVEYAVKEMPICKNIDSKYDIMQFKEDFRNLFLTASGFDKDEIIRTSLKELIDGLA
ncbi:hypothetical protein SteCoe_4636 [Stentor coeruleus]|uniref:RING-type domain-containing protein n=1 Tax=Stentor coeruleus TaxID=5963 RepID=A0A1R2CUC5_9CILI|nr:hypothetical protein SteCoe_4636 [Stentor coeruleus]